MANPLISHALVPVRITFGLIVLNGEPFTRYNLRSIYPWAYQIIVVEGACMAAASVATEDGHSTDGTLDVLRRFQEEEDPLKKLTIVTAEDDGHPNGFWPGEKHEMSQAYAKRATGNYLWQVDVDEFYRKEDMVNLVEILNRGVDAVTFPTFSFWGGLGFVENGEYFIVQSASKFPRLFAWGPGYEYLTHRPPTVLDINKIDTRNKKHVDAESLIKNNIYMYHYSMLLPKQVREKCSYYSKVDWANFNSMEQWAKEVFFSLKKPFAVCNSMQTPLSWIERYEGPHPEQILEMINHIHRGLHPGIELRPTNDIDSLLNTPSYKVGRLLRRMWVSVIPMRNKILSNLLSLLKRTPFYLFLRTFWRKLT